MVTIFYSLVSNKDKKSSANFSTNEVYETF